MFGNLKQKLAVAAVVALGAVAVPAAASAQTAVPPLQSGDTQAFASLTSGGPRITVAATRAFVGNVTLAPVGNPFRVTCTITASVTFNVDGTTSVPVANFTNCTTNVAGCTSSDVATAGSLAWGSRLVVNGGLARDRISVAFTRIFSGSCPWPAGSYPFAGVLSPAVTGGPAGVANATFDAASGAVSSVGGPATASGTLLLEAGQSPIFFVT